LPFLALRCCITPELFTCCTGILSACVACFCLSRLILLQPTPLVLVSLGSRCLCLCLCLAVPDWTFSQFALVLYCLKLRIVSSPDSLLHVRVLTDRNLHLSLYYFQSPPYNPTQLSSLLWESTQSQYSDLACLSETFWLWECHTSALVESLWIFLLAILAHSSSASPYSSLEGWHSLPVIRMSKRLSDSTMRGVLHVPPDRNTIIGRAIWKVSNSDS
jgi:hypothetical protein